MTEYVFALVDGRKWHEKLDPLYRQHYAEMRARLEANGTPIGEYNPQLARYFDAMDRGDLLTFIVMDLETVVGYCNVYVTRDMHNSELIAQEDAIYMLPEHRTGAGRKLVLYILQHLRRLGVVRVNITPVTDLRVGKIWARMGFKPVAELMTYTFPREAA